MSVKSKIIIILLLSWAIFADNPAGDARGELRHRLDSIEVEKQARKRQGLGIEDLEAVSAGLRDSLASLRTRVPQAAAGETAGEKKFALPWKIPFEERILSFRPNSVFDWIVVGTGLVAILSGLLLAAGIIAGRKKKPAERRKKEKAVSRKVNLAPTGTHPVVLPPKTYGYDADDGDVDILPRSATPAAGRIYDFGGRMSDRRRAAYNPNGLTDSAKDEERGPAPELQSLLENLRKVAPPPAAPAPPPPPPPSPEPPPLVVNASEPAPPAGYSDAGASRLSGALADRFQWAAPPGAGVPAFSELVIAASKNGLSEQEISKRYQLSVDQVRLILRMNK